jgi:hypothetical protein
MLDYWLKYTDSVQSSQAKLSPENRFSCLFVPTSRHEGFRKKLRGRMRMLEKTVLFYILKIDQEKDAESEVSGLEW